MVHGVGTRALVEYRLDAACVGAPVDIRQEITLVPIIGDLAVRQVQELVAALEVIDHEDVYGYSKFLFDQYVRRHATGACQVAGFRYFNVYGPREQHKGRMASVAYHFFHQYRETGQVRLFGASGGYAAGEQRRDFVSVEDVVKINLHFFEHKELSGIYNVGTGRAQTFNDVATATVNAMRRQGGEGPLTTAELIKRDIITYIPFPEALVGKYQSYTQADVGALREAGYSASTYDVAQGVGRYVEWLLTRPQAG